MNRSATVLTIGDELLIGQVIDTNSAWIGEQLSLYGIHIVEKIAVSDSKEGILSGVERAVSQSSLIIVTGGLGPTKDDITKKVLADYYNDSMRFDKPTYNRIITLFERWGREPVAAHKEQCFMPSKAEILTNKMGTAPGMLFRGDDHILISMPGVPYEMKHIFTTHITPLIAKEFAGQTIVHKTIQTAGEGESRIAARIDHILDKFPPHISMAFLPNLGKVRLRLTATGSDANLLNKEVDKYAAEIAEELGEMVFGYDTDKLITAIGRVCMAKGLTIGTAESCTGGRVASLIVNEAGTSAFFQGSTVTYSNALKMKLLGVQGSTLEDHGAVSEKTVKEMVKGAIKLLDVDVALAISGIAGPTGGSEDKPVGTIWLACGRANNIVTKLIKAGKDREKNIEYASNYALDLIRLYVSSI